MQCVLEAIRILRRRFGDEVAIIGKTMGPWSLGYHTIGRRAVPAPLARRPGRHRECSRQAQGDHDRASASRRSRRAPTRVTLPDHATGDLVSGEYYRRYLRDLHIEFAERLPGPDSSSTSAARRPTGWATSPRPGWPRSISIRRTTPAESMAHHGRPNQPRGQHQQPRDAVLEGPRSRRAPRSCARSTPVSRWSVQSARSRSRPRSRTCGDPRDRPRPQAARISDCRALRIRCPT